MQKQKTSSIIFRRLLLALVFTALAGGLIYFGVTNRSGVNKAEETVFAFNNWHYSREDSKEASAVLSKAGLFEYRWKDGALEVPKKEKARYEAVLAGSKAFPRAPSDVHQDALREMGLFESESKSRLRDLYAAARQLEQTLEHFSTKIDYATVGVRARNEQNGLVRRTVITASVGIWTREDEPITMELISAVTVAARHQLGISENNNISILDLRHGKSWLGSDEGLADPKSAGLKEKEAYWKRLLKDRFREIAGLEVELDLEEQISTPVQERSSAVLGHPGFSTFAKDQNEKNWQNVSLDRPVSEYKNVSVKIGIPQDYIRSLLTDKNDSAALLGETNRTIDLINREASALLRPLLNGLQSTGSADDRRIDPRIDVVVLNKPILSDGSEKESNSGGPEHLITLNKITSTGPSKVKEKDVSASPVKDKRNSVQEAGIPFPLENNASNNGLPSLIQDGGASEIGPSSSAKPSKGSEPVNSAFWQDLKEKGNQLWARHHLSVTVVFFAVFSFLLLLFSFRKKNEIKTDPWKEETERSEKMTASKIDQDAESHQTEKERDKRRKNFFEEDTEDEPIVRVDRSGHFAAAHPQILTSSESDPRQKKDPFDFLNQCGDRQLADLFEKERASFAAVALHFMVRDKREAVLKNMPEEKRRKIASFLSQPFKFESSLIKEVEKILRERCRRLVQGSI